MTDDLRAQFAELKAENAALRERVAALEAQFQPQKPRVDVARLDPPFPKSTYDAIDRMTVPKEITDQMERNVGTAGVRELVEDKRRRRG